jgi:hypothetical protein
VLLLLLLSILLSDFSSERKFTELKVAGAPCDSRVYETLKLVCEFTKALCVASRERISDFSNLMERL